MTERPYRILIWGATQIYNEHLLNLRYREEHGELTVVGIYDRGIAYGKYLDGYPLLQKEQILTTEHDYVVMMANKNEKAIIAEYTELGGAREKILPCRVLDVAGLTLSRYEQIRNEHFTLISSDCLGGFLYHTLGLPFDSPFINFCMHKADYRKIVSDLRTYMALTPILERYQEAMGPHDEERYPVLRLGDVCLFCNHSRTAEDALTKWQRRKQRINYEALVLTAVVDDKQEEEFFRNVEGYARKLIFTRYRDPAPGSIYLPSDGYKYYDQHHRMVRQSNNLLDLCSLFLGGPHFRRTEDGR